MLPPASRSRSREESRHRVQGSSRPGRAQAQRVFPALVNRPAASRERMFWLRCGLRPLGVGRGAPASARLSASAEMPKKAGATNKASGESHVSRGVGWAAGGALSSAGEQRDRGVWKRRRRPWSLNSAPRLPSPRLAGPPSTGLLPGTRLLTPLASFPALVGGRVSSSAFGLGLPGRRCFCALLHPS